MKNLIILCFCLLQIPLLKAQIFQDLDEVVPFHENLAAIRRDNQWAFINQMGEMVIEFRADIASSNPLNESEMTDGRSEAYPHFKEGRCLFRKLKDDGIYYYGYIDTDGNEVIAPDFVNATNFENGKAIVVRFNKIPLGSNELLEKKVVSYRLEEYVIDTNGKVIMSLFNFRKTVPKKIRPEEPPAVKSKLLGPNMVAVQLENGKWEIHKF